LKLERKIPIGKWPQGVVVSQGDAFVAESGQRRVARIDLATGEVKTHISVGRLPVELATGPDGTVYVLVHTDRKLIAIDPKTNRVRTVATLPDHPEDLVFADGALWVLLYDEGSSANSTVLRVNPTTGKAKRSLLLGKNANGLVVTQGRVWVCHGGPPGETGRISILDSTTLETLPDAILSAPPWKLAATPKAVYAGLFTNEIIRLDAKTMEQTHRAKAGAFVSAMLVSGDELFMATKDGIIRQLDGETMKVKAQFPLEKPIDGGCMVRSGSFLLMTRPDEPVKPGDFAETGSLMVFRIP
jgi:streptogramin lyase